MQVHKKAIQVALVGLCAIGLVAAGCGEEEPSATATASSGGATSGGASEGGGAEKQETPPAKKLSPEEGVKKTLAEWCASQKRGGFEA